MCPPDQLKFYCHSQSDKWIKANPGCPVSNPKRPLGENIITKAGMTLAKLAGIKNWEKFKNHFWRSYAFTKMNSSGKVTLTESMGAARHLSSNTHAKYIRNSGGTELARLQVLAGVAYIDVDLTDGKQKPSEKKKSRLQRRKLSRNLLLL